MTRCQIVLPARLASSRLSEKLLRRVGGKSVLQHTYEAASRATLAEGIVVAVDDPRMAEEVERFGGTWLMTSPRCASGTDRIAEVAQARPEIEVFVNVQADEPEIDPDIIDRVALQLMADPTADIATAGTPIRDSELLNDPACVKIVLARETSASNPNSQQDPTSQQDLNSEQDPNSIRPARAGQGRAVYFSRAAVPHVRDGLSPSLLAAEPPLFWHHIGLYAYRREFLAWFAKSPPSPLEQAERLEQLRAIEAGKRITVARVESATPGIDTQADLDRFAQRFAARSTSA